MQVISGMQAFMAFLRIRSPVEIPAPIAIRRGACVGLGRPHRAAPWPQELMANGDLEAYLKIPDAI